MGFHGGEDGYDRNFKVIKTGDLDNSNTENGKKGNKGKFAAAAVLVIIIGAVSYLYKDNIKEFAAYIPIVSETFSKDEAEKAVEMDIESGSKSSFVGYGNEYLYVTKDGVKFFDANNTQKWNYTYTMSSPVTVNNGNYTAVAESQGRVIRMYNETGEIYTVQPDGAVFRFSINNSGSLAAIIKSEPGYKILVYNETGQLLMERFEQDEGVYPIALDISGDGRILAVSYLDTTGIEMVSKILLFYTNKEDNKNTESGDFFGSIEKEGCVVPSVKYMENGSFAAVGDNIIFSINLQCEEEWTVDLNNELKGVSFGNGKHMALALGDEFAGEEGVNSNTVEIINSSGKVTGSYDMGVPITYISAYENGVVIGGNKNFVCLNYNGGVQWEYTATYDVKDIILMDNAKNVILVGNNKAEFMKMN